MMCLMIFGFYLYIAGVYGDVHRVKILFNKKDTALIQMAEPHQAQLGNSRLLNFVGKQLILCFLFGIVVAMTHLDKLKLWQTVTGYAL